MSVTLNEVDRVEILTLQDNYIDLLAGGNNEVIQRPIPDRSIFAEHGFSALLTVTKDGVSESVLLDFGFSPHGAAHNADILNVDYGRIKAMALSHGHFDHFGGLKMLTEKVGTRDVELVVHPEVFRESRWVKFSEENKMGLPPFTREMVKETGVNLVETREPYPMLDGKIFFLGEIPRTTAFEKGVPYTVYYENSEEHWDSMPDDTALVMAVKGKGVVVISGCAHSGIINTINYAKKITTIDDVFAVMGGFHLSGPAMLASVDPTIEGLKEINPCYIIPTHCTGRDSVTKIENRMPDKFILNMAGTNLVFSA